MSNVASLELCKELYELSGWKAELFWVEDVGHWSVADNINNYSDGQFVVAYDLGYLIRKLPPISKVVKVPITNGSTYGGVYVYEANEPDLVSNADTPEDAACKLAIELFKQGTLPERGTE